MKSKTGKITVIWSILAIKSLKQIFDYYQEKVSVKTAQNIVSNISIRTNILSEFPLAGKDFKFNKKQYKLIVVRYYKIIYAYEAEKSIIIHLVFDSRQNPRKLSKKLKLSS